MFCQKIKLPEAPGFTVGLWVQNESGFSNLSMELYKDEWLGDNGGRCNLPNPVGNLGQEISCNINYSITKSEEYYVCVDTQGSGIYKIRGYTNVDKCGFYGIPPTSSTPSAYQIFATPKKFAPMGTLQINNLMQSGEELSELIEEYILNEYGSLNCGVKECIVPLEIISGANQEVTFKELSLTYTEKDGPTTFETNFYDVMETSSLVNSGFQKISLDKGNFSVPSTIGNYIFQLKFKGSSLFTEEVEVKGGVLVLSIFPNKTAVSYPTTFRAITYGNKTISEYNWNFSDNTTSKTNISDNTHTYLSMGTYQVTIEVKDIDGITSSGTFNVEVGSLKEVLGSVIEEKKDDLEDIEKSLLVYDLFSAESIKEILELDEKKKKLII